MKDHISQAQAQNDYVLAQSRPAADMQEDTAQQEDAAAKPAAPQPKKAARCAYGLLQGRCSRYSAAARRCVMYLATLACTYRLCVIAGPN